MTPDVRRLMLDDDYLEFDYLLNRLNSHRAGNKIRSDIYDMASAWEDLGVAIPKRFKRIQVASGWGQKAVDHLARRLRMEDFTLPGGDQALDSFGIRELWEDNQMDMGLPQAVVSTLINSPSFLATLEGTEPSDPDVVFVALDAMHATGRWNWASRGLDSALLILDEADDAGFFEQATRYMLFCGGRAYELRRDKSAGQWTEAWTVERSEYALPRVPVEPLLYAPRIARPFGGTRITPAVRYLINAAMRTLVRTELGAEFFSTPQRYVLNVAEEDLMKNGKSSWDVLIGKMLTVGAAENPEDPDPVVGQFPQVSMQPNVDHFRMLATAFSGETGIPVGSLGVIQDNPSSAEAIYANQTDIVLESEESARSMAPSIKRTALNGWMIREGVTEVPDELKRLGVRWIDPSMPSRNQAADYVMKQVAGGVLPADSSVTLELLGHGPDTIRRLVEDRRVTAARETVRAALASSVGQEPQPPVAEVRDEGEASAEGSVQAGGPGDRNGPGPVG